MTPLTALFVVPTVMPCRPWLPPVSAGMTTSRSATVAGNAVTPSTGSTVDAHRLTIRNGGANSIGVSTYNYNAQSVAIDLRQSIVWDVAYGLKVSSGAPGATSTISWGDDDLVAANRPADNAGGGTATYQPDALQPSVGVDPRFVNPVLGANGVTGDYRLRHDSPLIDLGDATLSSGEQDLGGHDRVVDGDGNGSALADLGAFEYQRSAPVAVATSPTAMPVNPGDTVAFDASGSSDPDGDDITLSWQFDDGATAIGANASHAFASGGAHSGTVTVTDATGRTATAKVDVTVTTPPSGGTTDGSTGGTTDGSTGGTTSGSPGGTTGGPDPAVIVHGGRVRLDAQGRAAVRMSCPKARTTHCQGTLVLRHRKLVLGRARYDIAPGTSAKRRVRLGRAGRRLLSTHPSITATARAAGAHAALTLLRARRS